MCEIGFYFSYYYSIFFFFEDLQHSTHPPFSKPILIPRSSDDSKVRDFCHLSLALSQSSATWLERAITAHSLRFLSTALTLASSDLIAHLGPVYWDLAYRSIVLVGRNRTQMQSKLVQTEIRIAAGHQLHQLNVQFLQVPAWSSPKKQRTMPSPSRLFCR